MSIDGEMDPIFCKQNKERKIREYLSEAGCIGERREKESGNVEYSFQEGKIIYNPRSGLTGISRNLGPNFINDFKKQFGAEI